MNISFLSLDEVIAIHDDMVERYGGSHGIRDLDLIHSAVTRPQASFGGIDLYESIFDKAAALFHALLFNHAFLDANKRTAISATARFLYINGFSLEVDLKEFVDFPLRVENTHLSLEEIREWFRKKTKKIT